MSGKNPGHRRSEVLMLLSLEGARRILRFPRTDGAKAEWTERQLSHDSPRMRYHARIGNFEPGPRRSRARRFRLAEALPESDDHRSTLVKSTRRNFAHKAREFPASAPASRAMEAFSMPNGEALPSRATRASESRSVARRQIRTNGGRGTDVIPPPRAPSSFYPRENSGGKARAASSSRDTLPDSPRTTRKIASEATPLTRRSHRCRPGRT